MHTVDYALVFVLGACIGSFLNVCIYRIPENKSVVSGTSYCYSCNHSLNFIDMLPILNYFFLRGSCRYCGATFSLQYPLVELFTGFAFLIAYIKYDVSLTTLLVWAFFSLLIVVTVIDIHYRIIPDGLLLTGFIIGIPIITLQSVDKLIDGMIGFLVAGMIMFTIAVVSKGGMGGGDIKLSAVMGLYLGWQGVLLALFLAFLSGGLIGIALLVAKLKGRKDAVPFGPFLALGGMVAAMWGKELLEWYITFFSR